MSFSSPKFFKTFLEIKKKIKKFRQTQARKCPSPPPSTPPEIDLIMNHEKNEAELSKTKVEFNRGEIGILPTAKTDKSILDKYLHLENSNKTFI